MVNIKIKMSALTLFLNTFAFGYVHEMNYN